MIINQSDTVPTTLAEGTILTLREINTNLVVIAFQNLTSGTLSFKVQESVDGVTWTDVVNSFDLVADASVIKTVSSGNILRVRSSGVAADYGALLTILRSITDTNYVWTKPSL